MKNIKVESLKVKGYEFTGKIDGFELSSELIDKLGFNKTMVDLGLSIEVFGEYEIEWDDDIPMVQILNATVVGMNNIMVDLDLYILDLDSLSYDIEHTDTGDWSSDRIAAASDNYYDGDR